MPVKLALEKSILPLMFPLVVENDLFEVRAILPPRMRSPAFPATAVLLMVPFSDRLRPALSEIAPAVEAGLVELVTA